MTPENEELGTEREPASENTNQSKPSEPEMIRKNDEPCTESQLECENTNQSKPLEQETIPETKSLAFRPRRSILSHPRNFAGASSITGEVGVQRKLTEFLDQEAKKLSFRRTGEVSQQARVIEDRVNRAMYLVHSAVAAHLPGLTTLKDLTLCVGRTGNLFLWAVPVPDIGANENRWHTSARDARGLSFDKWTRMASNMAAGHYDIATAPSITAEPVWPDELTCSDVLRLAFGSDRLIDSVDHPFVRLLQGRDG